MEKVCTKCGEIKNIESFEKRSKEKRGSRCKQCVNLSKRKTAPRPVAKEGCKFCASCNEEKILEDFNIRFSTVLQRQIYFSYCKLCERKRDTSRYKHKCEMCSKEYSSGRKDNKICVDCHRELMRQDKVMYKYKERDFKGEKNSMYGKQRFGSENPNYKHGLSEEERYKKRLWKGYGIWRKEVYKRDNYSCQCCKKKSEGNIVAHHLDGYSWCVDKRTNVDNGITLCVECHDKFHSTYGRFNNTKEQFEQFINNLEYL